MNEHTCKSGVSGFNKNRVVKYHAYPVNTLILDQNN